MDPVTQAKTPHGAVIPVRDATAPKPSDRMPAAQAHDRIATASGQGIGPLILMAIGGSLLGVVGSFMPWFKGSFLFVEAEVSGIDGGDGYITLVASVIAAGLAVVAAMGGNSRLFGALVAAAGVVVAGTAVYDLGHYLDIASQNALVAGVVEPTYGIFVTAAGGAITAVAGLLAVLGPSPAHRLAH